MEILHFPSQGRPCPDGCAFQVCAECARHGLTSVHFRPDGICAFGHRLEVPLTDRLTAWIKAEGIEGNYPPDQIAARVVAQVHAFRLTVWLGSDDKTYLRDMCERIKDTEDLTDAEYAAELYWHGHDPR